MLCSASASAASRASSAGSGRVRAGPVVRLRPHGPSSFVRRDAASRTGHITHDVVRADQEIRPYDPSCLPRRRRHASPITPPTDGARSTRVDGAPRTLPVARTAIGRRRPRLGRPRRGSAERPSTDGRPIHDRRSRSAIGRAGRGQPRRAGRTRGSAPTAPLTVHPRGVGAAEVGSDTHPGRAGCARAQAA